MEEDPFTWKLTIFILGVLYIFLGLAFNFFDFNGAMKVAGITIFVTVFFEQIFFLLRWLMWPRSF